VAVVPGAAWQVDYVDLFLSHWSLAPGHGLGQPGVPACKIGNAAGSWAECRRGSWLAMEELYRSGRARAIGTSNYEAAALEEMRAYATVPCHVNQVEYHVGWHQVISVLSVQGRALPGPPPTLTTVRPAAQETTLVQGGPTLRDLAKHFD
jgi:diketogulonate reductase-like aldo/keto reductase